MRGCLAHALTLVAAALMFVANGVIVGMAYAQFSPVGPIWLRQPKVAQILIFIAPMILLAVQWWIFDRVSTWVARLARRRGS